MQVLVVVTFLGFVGWIYQVILTFFNVTGNSKIQTYGIISLCCSTPLLIQTFLMVRWFFKDTLKNRQLLIKGFKIQLITTFLVGIWETAGAYLIFGMTMQAYIIKNYPETMGYDKDGNCIDKRRCDVNTKVDLLQL